MHGCLLLIAHRDLARQISAADHAEAMERLEIYKTWFLETIMSSYSHNTFVVLPIADAQPHYRDDLPG